MEQNNTPLISVIVPVYNTEKYLDQCIQSVLAQTYTNWELLLIDDGSTDASGAICDKYAEQDSRIRVFHKSNGGVSSARNLGLDNAKGEWITFVDSDDYVDPDWLTAFDVSTRQTPCILYIQWAKCKHEKFNYLLHQQLNGNIPKNDYLLSDGYGFLWNKVFNSNIIHANNIRFDIKLSCYEDELFVLEYCHFIHEICIIPFAGYTYNVPNDFQHKYKEKLDIFTLIYHYEKTKCAYPLSPICTIDPLICKSLTCICKTSKADTIAIIEKIRTSIGSDIQFVKGLRKIPLKILAYTNIPYLWRIMFRIYSTLMRYQLI